MLVSETPMIVAPAEPEMPETPAKTDRSTRISSIIRSSNFDATVTEPADLYEDVKPVDCHKVAESATPLSVVKRMRSSSVCSNRNIDFPPTTPIKKGSGAGSEIGHEPLQAPRSLARLLCENQQRKAQQCNHDLLKFDRQFLHGFHFHGRR